MRILLASHVAPFPPDSGGRQRTALLMRALQEHGSVDLLVLANAHNRDSLAEAPQRMEHPGRLALASEPDLPECRLSRLLRSAGLASAGRALAYHGSGGRHLLQPDPAAVSRVRDQLDPAAYDLIVGRYLRTVAVCGLLDAGPPVLVDVDDNQPALLRARLPHTDPLTRLTLRRQLRLTIAAWSRLLPACRHLWVSLPADLEDPLLSRATLLPNIPFCAAEGLPEPPPFAAADPHCLAVIGTWTYSANASGLDRFLEREWPLLRVAVPGARLKVGGRVPGRWSRRWSRHPGVELAGYVTDLRAFYAEAAATIAPILYGGGTHLKVLESAAHGRAAIVTRVAARGCERTLAAGGGLVVTDAIEGMGAAAAALLHNPAAAANAGLAARAILVQNYGWNTFREAVAEGVNRATA